MKYIILIAFTPSELEKLANGLIEIGWQPQGGITLGPSNQFIQAMVKKEVFDLIK